MPDHVHNTFEIRKYIHIPKSHHPVAVTAQFLSTLTVPVDRDLVVVLPAIQFDNELASMTGKVCNVRSNRNLPSEMPAFILEEP